MIQLKVELPRFGCHMDQAEFKEIILELKAAMYPEWTDEELLYRCDTDARAFVAAVRSRVGCAGLPDYLIMRALVNSRKESSRK